MLRIAAATDQNNTTRSGLGESLLGVKWWPYEHPAAGEPKRIAGAPKQRELTVDFGGRRSLDKSGHLRLLFMGVQMLFGSQDAK